MWDGDEIERVPPIVADFDQRELIAASTTVPTVPAGQRPESTSNSTTSRTACRASAMSVDSRRPKGYLPTSTSAVVVGHLR
jgi:hypothetical protein